MSTVLTRPPAVVDRPGWIPPEIADGWDTNPYAYQTEEELMPGGGLHGHILFSITRLLRGPLKARGLMLVLDTLYADSGAVLADSEQLREALAAASQQLEQERQRADTATQRAEAAEAELARLRALLAKPGE